MKKVTCNHCGCKDAVDFAVRILCPIRTCVNFDKKLADEHQDGENSEIDLLADGNGNIYVLDLDDLLADLSTDDDI